MAEAHTRPAVPKMPQAPSTFPFSGCLRRQAINLTPPRRVSLGDGPLRPEVSSAELHPTEPLGTTRPAEMRPRHRRASRGKCQMKMQPCHVIISCHDFLVNMHDFNNEVSIQWCKIWNNWRDDDDVKILSMNVKFSRKVETMFYIIPTEMTWKILAHTDKGILCATAKSLPFFNWFTILVRDLCC